MCRLFLSWNRESNVSQNALKEYAKNSERERMPLDGSAPTREFDFVMIGYGIAGFDESTHRWSIYKSMLSSRTDPHFREVVERFSKYRYVVGHVRKKTDTNIQSIENTHPIKYKNHVCMHNGDIPVLNEKRSYWMKKIDADLRSSIRGTTDTEMLFYLFLSKHRETAKQYAVKRQHQDKPEYEQWMDSLTDTLEMIRKQTTQINASIIYANREYTLVMRYNYHSNDVNLHSQYRHAPPLYWNLPFIETIPSEGLFFEKKPKWLISGDQVSTATQTLVPSQTIMCLNHQTGDLHVRRIES